MKKLVRYYSGPFTYTGPDKSKKYTHITDSMYEDFNRNQQKELEFVENKTAYVGFTIRNFLKVKKNPSLHQSSLIS